MANEGNSETLWLWRPLSLYSAVASRLQATAAAFSGGATRLHATREVVAGEEDLEVVGDERAHVAVGGGKVAVYYLGVGIVMTMMVGTIGLACLFLTDIVRMGIKILIYESTNV